MQRSVKDIFLARSVSVQTTKKRKVCESDENLTENQPISILEQSNFADRVPRCTPTDTATNLEDVGKEPSNSKTVLSSDKQDVIIGGSINMKRFQLWKKNRPWLEHRENGAIYCKFCEYTKSLGQNAKKGNRVDDAFVKGIFVKAAKKLNDKISDHGKCQSHKLCEKVFLSKNEKNIEQCVARSKDLWKEQNATKLKSTAAVMRTAYSICKLRLSFRMFPKLINLQLLNGTNIGHGQVLTSNVACKNLICFIGNDMQKVLGSYIVESKNIFSLMVDEATTVSRLSCLIIYIRIMYNEEICNFFLDIVELPSTTGEGILDSILTSLTKFGITETHLKEFLVGFATDGAANMLGQYKGLVSLMKQRLHIEFTAIHCMNHKLELAVHDVVRNMNAVLHFQQLTDTLFALFSQSPKNQRELEAAAENVGGELARIGRVFDVRWVSSSCSSVTAIWNSFLPLVEFLRTNSSNDQRSTKDRSKFSGMLKKITKWIFLAEMAVLKDALETLQPLSLFLQRRDASVTNVKAEINILLKSFSAMKEKDALNVSIFFGEFSEFQTFKGQAIESPTSAEREKFSSFRKQFFQGLIDNIQSRFEDCTVMEVASVLSPVCWPTDEDEKILFGDREILQMCKIIRSKSSSIELVKEFRQYKETQVIGVELRKLCQDISVIPVSTAECERGFSDLNLTLTDIRSRMDVTTLSALLFVSVNGPTIEDFNAEKYAMQWIKAGRHSATDKPTGKPVTTPKSSLKARLFI